MTITNELASFEKKRFTYCMDQSNELEKNLSMKVYLRQFKIHNQTLPGQ